MIKNILITGSNGYLGNSFVNLYKDIYTFEKFSLLNQKIEDINFSGVDVVLHCAALVHQKIKYSYEKYHEINVDYPVKLAKLSKQNGVKQFVFISTISIYGENTQKLDEDTTCEPITPYGKSKLEAEKQLLNLNNDRFMVSIIRSPMIYGKNAPGNIDNLVKLVKKLRILPLAKIENKRSFISIQNLCYLINEVIQQGKNGIFLASDDETISTSKLIELMAKNLEKKVYLIKIPFFESLLKILKPSFHKRLYGSLEINNTITKQKLNLKNPYSLEEGIILMIDREKI